MLFHMGKIYKKLDMLVSLLPACKFTGTQKQILGACLPIFAAPLSPPVTSHLPPTL